MFVLCAVSRWTADGIGSIAQLRGRIPLAVFHTVAFPAVVERVTLEYRWQIGIVFLSVIQAILIGILLLERSRHAKLRAEQEQSASALRESEAKCRAILCAQPDMMFLLDEHGVYLDWYAKDQSSLYTSPEQFLGKSIREILPPDLAELFAGLFERVLSTGAPQTTEYTMEIEGNKMFFETRIVRCGDRKLLSIVRDLTDRKRFETEVRELSSRLLTLQDDERRRIARELHDITAQNLFAITINLENLKRQSIPFTPSGLEIFNECRDLCERSLQEVRTLSYLLHPPGLERVGLIPTLQWYVDGFARRSGISVKLEAARDMARLPMEIESDLFRVVQEGLSNVARHSGSQNATVTVENRTDHVVLQIRDSGSGLRHSRLPPEEWPRSGVGIASMRERLRRLGGQMRVESSNDGVSLVAQVPIPSKGFAHETID
jgi:two-component system, NarL family, sensor kinase